MANNYCNSGKHFMNVSPSLNDFDTFMLGFTYSRFIVVQRWSRTRHNLTGCCHIAKKRGGLEKQLMLNCVKCQMKQITRKNSPNAEFVVALHTAINNYSKRLCKGDFPPIYMGLVTTMNASLFPSDTNYWECKHLFINWHADQLQWYNYITTIQMAYNCH